MKYRFLIIIISLLCSLNAVARPARPGIFTFTQPDGHTFQAMCHGDEFMKIRTTADGHAIICGEDGWWYYAKFDSDGSRSSSGVRVGSIANPEVLSDSKNIPYDILQQNAMRRKAARAFSRHTPVKTKAEEKTIRHVVIILAQYNDVSFQYDRQHFVDMLTGSGYNFNGATGSAKEYLDTQFQGQVEFLFDVSPVVTLQGRRAYYGGNDSNGDDHNAPEMIKEACELADADIDFSRYDDDNDGYVDNVFVFFAGGDEADHLDKEDYIWSHSYYLESGAGIRLMLDGKAIDSYACTAELSLEQDKEHMAGIGTFCHEYSHTLGLPDFYDTDYEQNGWAAGLWIWTSLMDGGNMNNHGRTPPYYNAIERELLGISHPVVIAEDGVYTLEPIHKGGKYFRINTNVEGRYYLIECRSETEWDKYIRGSGMLIYRIDVSRSNRTLWASNQVNAYPFNQCADLIEADKRSDIFNNESDRITLVQNIRGVYHTNTGQIDLGNGYQLTNITTDGDNIRFNAIGFSDESTPPIVVNMKAETFMNSAIVQFESIRKFTGEATVTWGKTGGVTETISILPYEPGKYSVMIKGLEPGNKTYTVNASFQINGVEGEKRSISFMTPKAIPVQWPCIHLGKNRTKEDGTYATGTKVPLIIYNAENAQDIRWTFNGNEITTSADNYYTLTESGTLKAEISWEDGSRDIIVKKINLSQTEEE